jgi:CheY-like chemotaxis protein
MDKVGVIQVWGENAPLIEGNKAGLRPGAYVCINVRDTGCGIAPEDLKRIFDPFYTTKRKGSGLGLSTVYSIMKAHDGGLEADSTPGEESTFRVYFPACSAPAREPEPSASPARPTRGARVLVMDDELAVRKGIEHMLRSLGHRVEIAAEGDRAVELFATALENDPYDLVVLDLTVRGGKGGKETLELLRGLDPDVTAIAMSGYSTDNVFADPQADGFRASLPKPFGLEELGDTIEKVLGSRPET